MPSIAPLTLPATTMSRTPASPVPATPPPSILALPPYATTSPSRLQALYSDFSRQKASNPTSYHANVEWWRKAFEVLVKSGSQRGGGRLVLNAGSALMERVKVPKVGKPLALDAVITDLRATKSLILRSEFLSSQESIYNPGWLPGRIAAFVVGKPLWWALEQLGIVGEDGMLSPSSRGRDKDTNWWGEYVVVSLVEKAADEILSKQREKVGGAGDQLYSLEGFRKEFGPVLDEDEGLLSREDAMILLKYLERDRRAIIVDKELVKFLGVDSSAQAREINAVDRGILELKTAVENMHAQVDSIQQRIEQCTQNASAALRLKRKPVALSHIRSRKQLEDLLLKRLGSLNTLESTLISVEAAAGDIEIMKSYELSTATLRSILAHPSLQRDSIDKTMDALAEANLDAKEVDDAVHMGGDVAMGVDAQIDDDEIDNELNALLQEVEGKEAVMNVEKRLAKDAMRAPSEPPQRVDYASPHKEDNIPVPFA